MHGCLRSRQRAKHSNLDLQQFWKFDRNCSCVCSSGVQLHHFRRFSERHPLHKRDARKILLSYV